MTIEIKICKHEKMSVHFLLCLLNFFGFGNLNIVKRHKKICQNNNRKGSLEKQHFPFVLKQKGWKLVL
jgi:hypothetical protein